MSTRDYRKRLRLGSRGSDLARWQTDYVVGLLLDALPGLTTEIEIFRTKGDQVLDIPLPLVGGKGLFTAELEAALHSGQIDLAVHSLKDLPTEQPDGLAIGAIPIRANPIDVLINHESHTVDSLPEGAVIGTSSNRRAAQLRHYRPDLQFADIRGNVDTRRRKGLDPDGPYDATVLAFAGLDRLGLRDHFSQPIPLDVILPAPGQGALGIQCRDESLLHELLRGIHHLDTALAVTAERAFLAGLGGGCSVPVAAYGIIEDGTLRLHGRVSAISGRTQVDVSGSTSELTPESAYALGEALAEEAILQGADAILEENR
jgi:hydroxymethylbilane synthase